MSERRKLKLLRIHDRCGENHRDQTILTVWRMHAK